MNITKIDPLTLPSLPLGERSHLPNCPAIYFVLDGEQVLYIGQTVNLAQRWAAHNRLKQFTKLGSDIRVAWLECSDTQLLRQIERALTDYFNPLLNRTKNPDASKRISVVLPDDIGEAVEQMASGEMRSLSQMGAILITEAVKARQENNSSALKQKDKGAA